ncbi:MAG: homoserine O-succinyltransferase [Gammaproteobacteria bacterium]|nr:homoserine O-succinyltransferase [Gammaproteobacteria bacterium]MDH5303903.1 homoserine O-succinyltransferase [Gammaproteobacteria bacterium]MDH5321801.1 homoserine O-succinyltransferase [Gammaproteobacteria bacterium]
MPLVAHNDLPTFGVLRERGEVVLSLDRARAQDIRELHIGFLNMMPDAALTATERQFIRLVGSSNPIAQFYVYPFSIPELKRGAEAEDHIRKYYFEFEQLAASGLDALIITGANVINPSLDQEAFWDPLIDIVHWASSNVASIFCSCLATHALVKHFHGLNRQHREQKLWGVYEHTLTQRRHPLLRDVNTRFFAPHSRYNDVSRAQFESAGLHVLAESAAVGVHLAVSPDQFRVVYFQGHPEYSAISLMKECKREVNRYITGERARPPRVPENYFTPEGEKIASAYINEVIRAVANRVPAPEFPETELAKYADNTWGDTGKAIVNNWLGLVYQLTNLNRHEQFMPGVNPDDPLGLKADT